MSDEPNHPIESELKAYARQRRVELGRPQHLPPAMRERLLREAGVPEQQRQAVAAADPPEERPMRLPAKDPAVFAWWPRLLIPGLGFAVVVIGLAILFPRWAQLTGRGVQEEARHEDRASETELQLRERMQAKQGQAGGQRVAQAPSAPLTELEALAETRRVDDLKREADEGRLSLARSRTDSPDKFSELRRNEAKPAPTASRPAAPAPAVLNARAEADKSRFGLVLKDAPAEAKQYREEVLADALATAKTEKPAVATTAKEQSSFDTRANLPVASPAATTLAATSQASAPRAPVTAPAGARFFQKSGAVAANQPAPGNGQQFVQNAAPYRRNLNSPPPPPVMNNFNFEQTGEAIRIVDADGSVYLGRVENVAKALGVEAKKTTEGLAKSAAVSSLNDQASASQFVFRANGTNLSLNQAVQIEGNYFAIAPGLDTGVAKVDNATRPAEQLTAGSSARTLSNLSNNSSPGAGQNVQIRGRVTIGSTNQLLLNALPVQK